jgi:hypothetical protein
MARTVLVGTIFITLVVRFAPSPKSEVYASTIVPIVVTLAGVVSEADPEISTSSLGHKIIIFILTVNRSEFHA